MSNEPSRIFAGSIPSYVLSSSVLWPASKLVYAIISGFAANNRDCFISNGAIGEALGLTNRHVIRCIRQLECAKFIKIKSISGQRVLNISLSNSIEISTKKTLKTAMAPSLTNMSYDRPNVSEGVTYMSGGGDIHVTANDTGGVTPMSPISTTSLKESTLYINKECTPISKNDDVFVPVKDCPLIKLTQKEKDALIARYKLEGLSMQNLKDGCELFNQWLLDEPRKAAKRKSHYRCLIGWVLKESLTTAKIRAEKQSADMRLERSKQVLKTNLPGENPHDNHARKINEHRAKISARNNSSTHLNGSTNHVGNILKTMASGKNSDGH